MSQPDPVAQPRKRLRNSFVCSFCKRRKVRCDKAYPCLLCVKYGNSDCEYPTVVAKATSRNEHNGYGEAVMTLDSPPSAYSAAPEVHSELALLKRKIQMLETSVQMKGLLTMRSLLTLLALTTEPYVTPALPVWRSHTNDDLLFLLGFNPYVLPEQTYLFHDHYVPFMAISSKVARHHGALSWVALIKTDSATSQMLTYKHRLAMKKRIIYSLDRTSLKPAEHVFGGKLQDDVEDDEGYASATGQKSLNHDLKRKINERARAVGLTVFEGEMDSLDLLGKITIMLPSRKVVWMLIERFFDRVYPYFPYLDQFDFEERVRALLGPVDRSHTKIEKIHVSHKMDVIYLGQLLVVLRLSYLTLFTNNDTLNESRLKSTDPSASAQETKFLLNNPIDMDAIDVALMCLLQFGYLRFCNLPILQLLLYLKLYYTFAPESGDCPEDANSQAYTAMLINMATNLGLHREPDVFDVEVRDERTNNLCRKIWFCLLATDIQDGMTNGIHLNTRRGLFDTKPPFYKPGNENVRNIAVEKEAIYTVLKIDNCYDSLSQVIAMIADVGKPIYMKELSSILCSLESEFIAGIVPFCSLESRGQPVPISASETMRTKIYFQSNFFMASICLHFFNYYERENKIDLAYYYLKKVITISVHNMMPYYDYFIEKSATWFENTTDLAVTPSFQVLIHKCMIVVQCVMLRSRFSILQMENEGTPMMQDGDFKTRYELLKETWALCDQCMRTFQEAMSKLSSRYYYSWRCLKAQESLKVAREGTDYYLNFCKGKEVPLKLASSMLADLNSILASALETVKSNKERKERSVTPFVPDDLFRGTTPIDTTANVATASQSQLNYLTEDVDDLWMQMLSLKPQMSKLGIYSRTPPTVDFDLGLGVFDNTFPGFDNKFVPDNIAGAGFLEALLDDPIRQDL